MRRFRTWRHGRGTWQQARWMALDIETNGLSPKEDAMLSLAWVPIQPPVIALDRTGYSLLHSDTTLNQSATIHQLSSSDLASGRPLKEVLEAFTHDAQDHFIVAHNVQFDRSALQAALARAGMRWRADGWYCTLLAEKKRLERAHNVLPHGSLTLAASRARYGLADFTGHHALHDAIACAELFLAQAYRSSNGQSVPARRILKDGR